MKNLYQSLQNPDNKNFFLISGPCVVENEKIIFETAEKIKSIAKKHHIPFVFKSSYRKANRSSLNSFSTIGEEKALSILKAVKSQLDIPILTDIHSVDEANKISEIADIIQIPAFLCRQTDLLVAAGKTQKIINIKKGQFLSPDSMKYAADKVFSTGNNQIMFTERGTTFGYQDLVVDFRSIPIMKSIGYPVILDITHSLQQPNQSSGITGGLPHLIETIAKAGIASGVDGIFIETHPNPSSAMSDGANMLKLDLLEELLEKLVKIRKAIL